MHARDLDASSTAGVSLRFIAYLVDGFAAGLLKLLNSLAQALGQFRQLSRPKQDQHQREDQNDLAAAKIKKPKQGGHRVALRWKLQ